jgi:hypothetical protein
MNAQFERNLKLLEQALWYAQNIKHGRKFREGAYLINKNKIKARYNMASPNQQRRARAAANRMLNSLGVNFHRLTRSNWVPNANVRLVAAGPIQAKLAFNRRNKAARPVYPTGSGAVLQPMKQPLRVNPMAPSRSSSMSTLSKFSTKPTYGRSSRVPRFYF